MQSDAIGEQVAGGWWPRDGVQPHGSRLADIHAATRSGRDCPQWSRMPAHAQFGVRRRVMHRFPQRGSRIRAAQAAQPIAQPYAGVLRHEHDIRGPGRERRRPRNGERCGSRRLSVVAGPTHPRDRPSRRHRPRTPQGNHPVVAAQPTDPVPDIRQNLVSNAAGYMQWRHRTAHFTSPVRMHEIWRPHSASAARAAHREGHGSILRRTPSLRAWLDSWWRFRMLPNPGVHRNCTCHTRVDRPSRAVLGDRTDQCRAVAGCIR
jgi:hypothetical protein